MFIPITNKNKKIKKNQIIPLRYNPKNEERLSPFEKIFENEWIDFNSLNNGNKIFDKMEIYKPVSIKELNCLMIGDFCLIGDKNELFWIEICEINKHEYEYVGKILNELEEPRFYDKGCLVRFFQNNILKTRLA